MGNKFENFLKPPSRELNCNAFVQEVNTQIAKKYRELQIEAINLTNDDIESRERKKKFVKQLSLPNDQVQKLLQSIDNGANRSDLLSAHSYMATVDIMGWKPHLKELIKDATNAILTIGKKYDSDDIQSDMQLDEIPLSSHITAFFS